MIEFLNKSSSPGTVCVGIKDQIPYSYNNHQLQWNHKTEEFFPYIHLSKGSYAVSEVLLAIGTYGL